MPLPPKGIYYVSVVTNSEDKLKQGVAPVLSCWHHNSKCDMDDFNFHAYKYVLCWSEHNHVRESFSSHIFFSFSTYYVKLEAFILRGPSCEALTSAYLVLA